MASFTNLMIGIGAEYKGKRAFGQAETATQKLGKSVKNLGLALGVTFSTRAIFNFAKASAKASLEAQSQQNRLARVLEVTNGASAAQIDILTRQSKALEKLGVVSAGSITQVQSELATFDLQIMTIKKLTPAILDYVTAEKGATATAGDFKAMTKGLAQALNGNFASLTRTGFVLDEVTKKMISTGTESERAAAIVKVLESTYKGFNEKLAQTPAGKMQLLANAADDARVIIGDGLVTALSQLTDGNVVGLADSMRDFATQTQFAIIGVGELIEKLKSVPGFGKLGFDVTLIPVLGAYLGYFIELGEESVKIKEALSEMMKYPDPQSGRQLDARLKLMAKTDKALAKSEKERLAVEKKKTAELKARAKLEKANRALNMAGTIFDLDKIQLLAALQSKITQEDRDKLNLKLLLLNAENQTGAALSKSAQEATILSQKILMQNGLVMTYDGLIKNLAKAKNPFEDFDDYTKSVLESIRQIQLSLNNLTMPAIDTFDTTGPFNKRGGIGKKPYGPTATEQIITTPDNTAFGLTETEKGLFGIPNDSINSGYGMPKASFPDTNSLFDLTSYQFSKDKNAFQQAMILNETIVNVNASYIANSQEIQDLVQNAIQNANRAGNSTNYAGQLGL